MTTTSDVATRDQQQTAPSVAQFITKLQPEIARALPKGMDADRVARLALTVVRQSDIAARKEGKPQNSLANCSVESFGGALLTASALGLEPGVNGEAYLVPYKGECTLIVGYQGYAKLFYQHPLARNIDARAVHANDDFDYGYGTTPFLKHKPARGDRGDVTDYYAVATLSTGASAFVVLSPAEVKALRGGKVGPSGKIADPQRWMERKTVLRQLVKLLPKSTQLAAAIAVDDQVGSELVARQVPAAIADGEPVPELPPTVEAVPDEPERRVSAAEIRGEVVDAELPEPPDDWEPSYPPTTAAAEPTWEEPKLTRSQNARQQAQFNGLGIRDRDLRLTITRRILDLPGLESSAELTNLQAQTLIDTLDEFNGDGARFRAVFDLPA